MLVIIELLFYCNWAQKIKFSAKFRRLYSILMIQSWITAYTVYFVISIVCYKEIVFIQKLDKQNRVFTQNSKKYIELLAIFRKLSLKPFISLHRCLLERSSFHIPSTLWELCFSAKCKKLHPIIVIHSGKTALTVHFVISVIVIKKLYIDCYWSMKIKFFNKMQKTAFKYKHLIGNHRLNHLFRNIDCSL